MKEIFAELSIFKRALAKEKKKMMEKKNMNKPPSQQDVKTDMELSGAYRGIFKVIGYFVNSSCGNSYRGTFF